MRHSFATRTRLGLEMLENRTTPALFTVTAATDNTDPNDGLLTLREAIDAANRNDQGADTITFDRVLQGTTIALTQGELALSDPDEPIRIQGANQITVRGNGSSRVFRIDEQADVELVGLRITGGADVDMGGGIDNRGTLAISQSQILENSALLQGGGLVNWGQLTVQDTIIEHNSSSFEGGGISNQAGALLLIRSSVSGNTARVGGGLAANTGGSVTLLGSTVVDNTANYYGGGLANAGNLTIQGSTLAGNIAQQAGGGGLSNAGTALFIQSTLSGNRATAGGGVDNIGSLTLIQATVADNEGDVGAGLLNRRINSSRPGEARLANTIVAGSQGEDLVNRGGSLTGSNNLIQDGSEANSFDNTLSLVDPLLGPLVDNGGGTFTHALGEGSPARDAGLETNIPLDVFDRDQDGITDEPDPFDQRGLGFVRAAGDIPDIGAFEFQTETLQVVAFSPTPTGFFVELNRPIVLDELNLYDADKRFGPADLTLSGPDGVVRGSLLPSADAMEFTFIATGAPLEAGDYQVTLVSGSNAFADPVGDLLDGNGDGVPGDAFTTSFTVANNQAVTVSIPDFARGPGELVRVPSDGLGLPLVLSEAEGVNTVTMELSYDPAMLLITGAQVAPGLPVGTQVTLDTPSFGIATISFSSPSELTGSDLQFVNLLARVPDTATFGLSSLISVQQVVINAGARPAEGDVALQLIEYFGDANSDGNFTIEDNIAMLNIAAGTATGFAAYPRIDPILIGDLNHDGRITVDDITRLG